MKNQISNTMRVKANIVPKQAQKQTPKPRLNYNTYASVLNQIDEDRMKSLCDTLDGMKKLGAKAEDGCTGTSLVCKNLREIGYLLINVADYLEENHHGGDPNAIWELDQALPLLESTLPGILDEHFHCAHSWLPSIHSFDSNSRLSFWPKLED